MNIKRNIPVADQVTLLLHQRILDGEYQPGERILSEKELAQQLNVSRGTVRSAMATLASQGLVVRKQGDGTYVSEIEDDRNSFMYAIWEYVRLIRTSGREPSIVPISMAIRKPTADEERALEIKEQEDVVHIERLFYADDKPIIFSNNMSPSAIFLEDLRDLDASLGIGEFLKRYCDREIISVDVDISPVMPNDLVRQTLSMGENEPVLQFEEIFRDINGLPLVFTTNLYNDKKLSLHGLRPWYSVGNMKSLENDRGL